MATSNLAGHGGAGPWTPDPPLFIGIAGGSGSGKTTIAEAPVVQRLGGEVVVIQHDAYHRQHTRAVRRGAVSGQLRPLDNSTTLETELLVEHLGALRAGKADEKPVHDFANLTVVELIRSWSG